MSGRDDESCGIMRSGAGGVRCHSTEGIAEERRGGGSGSGRQAGARSIRGSPYRYSFFANSQIFLIDSDDWNR